MIRRVTATLSILLLLISFSSNAYADAICNDGWKSKSSGSGTCSWHGGVLDWLPKTESSSSYSRDSYYDNSDNGSGNSGQGLCVHKDRRDGETLKECNIRKSNDIRERFLNQVRAQRAQESSNKEYESMMLNQSINFDEFDLEPLLKDSEYYYNPFGQ
jgi:hypothetical protein